MKTLLFILLTIPILSQELMINSFNSESDFNENYWILDLTGDSELGYANYSESSISHDGIGAIQFDYSIHNSEDWGGFTKLSHFHPDQNSVYDLSDFNAISFWFYNEAPASLEERTEIRFVLYDISTSPNNDVYFLYSLTGPGPSVTSYGTALLSFPIKVLIQRTTTNTGTASWYGVVPISASGRQIWLQALDASSLTWSNGVYQLIL